ncbi:MAG: FkbM family methyltransferase [Tabrizicola sp.]|nr:FkbM family methyltransferase [Tabrizicola sp.]
MAGPLPGISLTTATRTEMSEAEDPLKRMKRRHKRDLRVARAQGMLQGVLAMLRPGDVAIDCGANRGDITALLAATGADVHAFEPDPYNLAKLEARFAGTPNVRLYPAAVGTRNGQIRLMRASNWDANPDSASVKSTIIEGVDGIAEDEGIDVPLVDLPAMLRELAATGGPVAFLKMDIEGAELDLLDLMLTDRLFDLVRLTVAETHERKFKELSQKLRFAQLRAAVTETYPPTRVNLDWI